MGVLKNVVEPTGAGHFLVGPYDPNHSAEPITLAATAVVLPSGTMLGQVTVGALTGTLGSVVAAAGGTPGNATYGTITVDAGAQTGRYWIEYIDPTHFNVLKPDGSIDGSGELGSAYNGSINLSAPTAGATAHVEDDRVPVDVAAADGSGVYKPIDPAATDGTQSFAAILYEGRPILAATQKAVGVARNVSHVNGNLLTWINSMTTDQKNAIIAQAKAKGVVIRF